MSDEPEYIHTEADLSKQLGLSREDVRAARAELLENGADWKHVRGAVRYTSAAWGKLKGWLKISTGAPPAVPPGPALPAEMVRGPSMFPPNDSAPNADAANAEGQTDPQKITIKPLLPELVPGLRHDLVCFRHYPNRRIVGAYFGPQLVRVRVKDSAKITKGMVMPCEWLSADLWELRHKLPRRKGKW